MKLPVGLKTIEEEALEGVDFLVVYCSDGFYAQQYARGHGLVIVNE